MTLLDRVLERHNHFIDSVSRMRANGNPVVMFGAGCVAQMTWEFMVRENMPVDKVALNRQYITEGMTFHGLPVVAIEDLVEEAVAFNCIVALQYVSDALQQYLHSKGAEVLVYDPAFIGVGTTLWYTAEFCAEHAGTLNAFYDQLGDERSRDTLVAFLNQRISARRGTYQAVYEPMHYFPVDLVRLQDGEVFVDCGAYNGDSIQAFMREVERQHVAGPRRIIGFEPESGNFAQLCSNTRQWAFCEQVNKGVWNKASVLYFQPGQALSSRLSEQGADTVSIELDSIDNILQGGEATFIKMDIEGSELKALQGAENTIRTCKPLLAISLYHKPEDLLTIPQYIQSLNNEYAFYLRGHHPEMASEMVLYAVPKVRDLT